MKITLKDTPDKIAIVARAGKFSLIEEMKNAIRPYEVFPMTIEMPCGLLYLYPNYKVFPEQSLQCNCGDEEEWVIKYELN